MGHAPGRAAAHGARPRPAAVPAGTPPGLLGGGAAGPGGGSEAMQAPGGGAPLLSPEDGDRLLLDGEDQQGYLELYRRAYGRHLDVAYPPAYVALASLALSSGAIPFWLAVLLVPACFVLGVNLVLVRGGWGQRQGRAGQGRASGCSCLTPAQPANASPPPACSPPLHAGGGIPPGLIPFSRFPAAMVGSLEVLSVTTFVVQVSRMLWRGRHGACVLVTLMPRKRRWLPALAAGCWASHAWVPLSQVLPWLAQELRWSCLLLIVLSAAFLTLHLRRATCPCLLRTRCDCCCSVPGAAAPATAAPAGGCSAHRPLPPVYCCAVLCCAGPSNWTWDTSRPRATPRRWPPHSA